MDIGFKVTVMGRRVLAACMSDGNALEITGVTFGDGLVSEGTDLADVTELVNEIAYPEGTIAEWYHKDELLYITTQYANVEHPLQETFYIREFIVWARDPDGEDIIPFIYGTLGDYGQPVPQYDAALPSSTFSFPMVIVVSSEVEVDVTANPGLVTTDTLMEAIQYAYDDLSARIISNTVRAPMLTNENEFLLTESGVKIYATQGGNA